MEKILLNNEIENDFTVQEFVTEKVDVLDEMYDPQTPYTTHGFAVRADGAKCFFQFLHAEKTPVISPKLAGAMAVNELRIGFYLRRSEKASESKIIRLGAAERN